MELDLQRLPIGRRVQDHLDQVDAETAGDPIPVPLARGADLGPNPFAGTWNVSDLDAPLTPLVRMPPVYPSRAKRRGIEGWVRVKFQVKSGGEVARVEILEAQPEKIFDDSVRNCVSGWRFKPGTVAGEPVDVWVVVGGVVIFGAVTFIGFREAQLKARGAAGLRARDPAGTVPPA